MRLAMVAWEALYALPVGGVAVHVSSLAEALARRGHDVHIFTRRGPGQTLRDRIGGVDYHRCPFVRHPAFIDEVEAFGEPVRHYLEAEEAAGGAFDRVQAHDWPAFPAALAAGGGTRRPLAATFHSTEWGRSGQWPQGGTAARIAEWERGVCRRADAVTAISGAVRRELTALYQPPDWKTETAHQGVDLSPFDTEPFDARAARGSLGVSERAPLALFVGRLDRARGADRLGAMWSRVASRRPDARLALVGDGPEAEALRAELSRAGAGVEESARFAGWREGGELAALYRAATVLVAPGRRDPYGQVVLLAWAARRPAVATREGAAGEFLLPGLNGWLADTPEAMADALLESFSDPSLTDWLGENGRTAVETAFTWDRLAERTEALFARAATLRGLAPDS